MNNHNSLNLNDYDVKKLKVLSRISLRLGFCILKSGKRLRYFPYMYKRGNFSGKIKFNESIIEYLTKITNLEQSIQLAHPLRSNLIKYYDKEFMIAIGYNLILFLATFFPLAIILYLGFLWIYRILQPLLQWNSNQFGLFYTVLVLLFALFVFYFFVGVVASIISRFIKGFITKRFSNVLCIVTVLYIVYELSRDDILIIPKRRKDLIMLINLLAETTLFLPATSKILNESSQAWVEEHFENISFYISERGRWACSPTISSLDGLRRDFTNLAIIYITERYGEFQWMDKPSRVQVKLTYLNSFLAAIPKIMSIAIPLILLSPPVNNQIKLAGIQPGIVSLILIAWLLISVDSLLKLGVIQSFVEISKGIKELK